MSLIASRHFQRLLFLVGRHPGLRRLLGGDQLLLLFVGVVGPGLFLRRLFLNGFRRFVAHGGWSFD